MRSAPADRVKALMQAGRQCIRHNARHPWLEFSQQLKQRAPAFDLLISGDVSAHEARIRFCGRRGNPLEPDPGDGNYPACLACLDSSDGTDTILPGSCPALRSGLIRSSTITSSL